MKKIPSSEEKIEKSTKSWFNTFKSDMRRVRWSSLSNTWKIFLITVFVIFSFALLFYGFDALVGFIFDATGLV